MAFREKEFFCNLSEIRQNFHLLEECNDQLKKYNLLTPKHTVTETLRSFNSTVSLISSQIRALRSYANAAIDENKPKFEPHCRLLEKRLVSLESAQRNILNILKMDEDRFQEERNQQAKEELVHDQSIQTSLSGLETIRTDGISGSNSIGHVESGMIEVARLFQEVEAAVHKQQPVIEKLEGGTEEAKEQIPPVIEDLVVAVDHAKTYNRTLFWVIGIICAIIAVGVVVSVVVVKVVLK